MTPFDIVKVLTAAAPIAASVASIVNNSDCDEKPEKKVEQEKQVVTNTINISVTNNFFTKPDADTLQIATEAQSNVLDKVGIAAKRYDL